MFQHHRMKLSAILLALLLAVAPATVYADGTTSIATSGNSAQVGDKVTVTVTGSDSSKLSLRYNNNVLKFQNCSAAGYSTEGNVITFNGKSAQITFEAADSGSGDLVLSSDVLSGSSTSVQVAAAAAPEPEPEEEETADDASTKKASGDADFTIDGTDYVLSERYADSEIPAGFSKTSMKIHGGTYRELSNGSLTLVYLKPADNIAGSGVFYVYDKDSDSVSPFAMLGTSDYYVLLATPDELLTDSLAEAKIKVKGAKYDAYQLGDTENGFYYVYGTDSLGTTGWFSYDSEEETVQRANEALLTSGVTPADGGDEDDTGNVKKEKKKKSSGDLIDMQELMDTLTTSRNLLAVGIFALVVLFIIILDVLLFRRRRDDDDDDFDYDDDYDDRKPENDEPEVMTVENILEADDFEEANKPHKNKKFFGRDRQTDIWDTADGRLSDTGELPFQKDDSSKLKKQVFRGRGGRDSGADGEDGKVDLIDLNDL